MLATQPFSRSDRWLFVESAELGAQVHVQAMKFAPFGSLAVLEDPTGAPFGFWQAGEHIGSEVNNEPGATAPVSKGCTSPYHPNRIESVVGKKVLAHEA